MRKEAPLIGLVIVVLGLVAVFATYTYVRDYDSAAIQEAQEANYTNVEVIDSTKFATLFRGCGYSKRSYEIVYLRGTNSEGVVEDVKVCVGLWDAWIPG